MMPGRARDRSRKELEPLDDPDLIAFLPMVYVAWADGDLSHDEVRAICSRVTEATGEDASCHDRLGRWLDPEKPPSAADLQGLLGKIRRAADGLDRSKRRSLTTLGLELARAGGREIPEAELRALQDVERALGLAGTEAARLLLEYERPTVVARSRSRDFDVGAMQRMLDGDRAQLRDRVKRILSRPGFRYVYAQSTEDFRQSTLQKARELAAEGIGALSFPREFGGEDDLEGFIVAFETAAFGDLSLVIKMGVQFGLFGGSILQLGNKEQQAEYLPRVGSLDLPGCFAMTETGHGSNVHDLETLAQYEVESEEFVIHTPSSSARKDYIGNAALHGQMATVFAQLEVGDDSHGVHAFLVPIREETGTPARGVTIEDCGEKLGLNGVDNGRLTFDRVRIPRANLLDRFGTVSADGEYSSPISSASRRFFTMLGTLAGGRVSVALAGLSATKSALAIAVRYGEQRRQFGAAGEAETTLLDYPSHQSRLLPRLATTYALDFALADLTRRFAHPGEDRRQVETLAAGLKAFATWHATETIQGCRESCGGQGYLAVNRFAALKADSDVFTTFEGDNTVLLQLVAKSLLTGFRRQFGEMSALGLVRYVAGQAAVVMSELNPIVTRNTSQDHLRDRGFHLGALQWREQHLLGSLARRLKKRIEDGMESFHALVECQDHAIRLAKAHTERVVLERFADAVEGCADESLRAVLSELCDLFALERIERDLAWFQEHRYVESAKAKAIHRQVHLLCREVRPRALALVDSFGIPDELLAAPIAARLDFHHGLGA